MEIKKKRVTIRMLSCLLAICMSLSGITPAFAAGSGKDYGTKEQMHKPMRLLFLF